MRNLIRETIYKKLPYQPVIRDSEDCRVIGGNGKPLDLTRFTVLPVTLGSIRLWHKFGVIPNLPLKVLIGAVVLLSHQCSLLYSKNNQKKLLFGHENCPKCDRFRTNSEVRASVQFKFVDENPKHRRNRFKLSENFVATLPETDKPDQEKN